MGWIQGSLGFRGFTLNSSRLSRISPTWCSCAWTRKYACTACACEKYSLRSLRSLRRHETWLKALTCPVIRLDTTHHSVGVVVSRLLSSTTE